MRHLQTATFITILLLAAVAAADQFVILGPSGLQVANPDQVKIIIDSSTVPATVRVAPGPALQLEAYFTAATPSQVFTLAFVPCCGSTLVFRNGLKQRKGTDYQFVASNSITFPGGVAVGDQIDVVFWKQ